MKAMDNNILDTDIREIEQLEDGSSVYEIGKPQSEKKESSSFYKNFFLTFVNPSTKNYLKNRNQLHPIKSLSYILLTQQHKSLVHFFLKNFLLYSLFITNNTITS